VTYGNLTVDRCTECQGIWFDTGEAEALKERWMGEALDTGDPEIGKRWNEVEDVECPRCGAQMHKTSDPTQPHIWYEVCHEQGHGMFFDAGEFTDYKYETLLDDYKYETLLDKFRDLLTGKRPD
jgi:Zn-finger nucleic acid-binding protein